MKEIHLNGQHGTVNTGKVALVDDCDYERINKYKWTAHLSHDRFYVVRTVVRVEDGKRKWNTVHMHREVLEVKDKSQLVDHIDNDGLNNLRSNLRIVTKSQNAANQRKRIKKASSIYKGVSYVKSTKKWRATCHSSSSKLVKEFDTEEEAASEYNMLAIALHGKFAKLNDLGKEIVKSTSESDTIVNMLAMQGINISRDNTDPIRL